MPIDNRLPALLTGYRASLDVTDELLRWIPSAQSGGSNPELRLLCFPHAGAGSSAYRDWHQELPGRVQLLALRLPGRENRWGEPPCTDMSLLVSTLAPLLRPLTAKPYALFGHSMGALICFELARQIRREGLQLPAHLFLSGVRAPHIPWREPPLHEAPDAVILAELTKRRWTDAALRNAELAKILIPIVRADMKLCETYYPAAEPPLDIPMSVYGGRDDVRVQYRDLVSWRFYTQRSFRTQLFPGDHFFLRENRGAFLRVLSRELSGILNGLSGGTGPAT